MLAVFHSDAFAMGGVHVGYNWQDESWVFGLEGDIAAVEDAFEYLASVRGRLGWASDNMLFFATGGMAFARRDELTSAAVGTGGEDGDDGDDGDPIDSPIAAGGPGGAGGAGGSGGSVDHDNEDETGFVIGAGLETMVSEHVSIGMEGLYYFFDDSKVDFFADGDKVDSISTNNDLLVARARLTFHFNNSGP
jgi:opacity protein-like surface antigen